RNQLREIVKNLRAENRLPNSLLHKIAASPTPPEMITEFLQNTDFPVIDPPVRLMLAGSVPGHWELELIESMSAKVVADGTCLGDRAFHDIVPENGDLLKNLYDSYIENNLCPHRRPQNRVIDYIHHLAEERHVDGIVFLTLKYCHPWGLSAVRFKDELGYPFLRLDDDLTSPAPGNMRTRVGAFIEMLKSGNHRKTAV
ncbi:MAG: 2-hydroxyacyl-CoA dehydratase, partial [FCB group bacterium]|nr:2-hydroxyacyl-CoA dehydratase [FCB group bacterium]